MPKDQQSVAPKERVNITYKPATGDAQEEVELPLKVLALGDYTGRPDETPVEDRKAINIDKDNFNSVMEQQKLSLSFSVKDKLNDGEEESEIPVELEFKSIKDFTPEAIVNNVPELRKLMELREALIALKHPLGNNRAFRKRLESILGDEAAREKLLGEITKDDGGEAGE